MSQFFIHARFYSSITKLLRMLRIFFKVAKGIPRTLRMATGPYDTATPFTATIEEKKKGLVFSNKQRVRKLLKESEFHYRSQHD